MTEEFNVTFVQINYPQRPGYDLAEVTFDVTTWAASARVQIEIDAATADQADFVKIARARLHGMATDLAAWTEKWALPDGEQGMPPRA